MTTTTAKTPLHSWHVAHGARMTDFAGWDMPIQYSSIVEEHEATRSAAAVFDVSHMGRLRFDGQDAANFLDRLVTRRVLGMEPGMIRYSLATNDQGGILDDVLVYHLQSPSGTRYHMLVVNASNRLKILDWIKQQLTSADRVIVSDRTMETAMIAVQGPQAIDIVDRLVDAKVDQLGYYRGVVSKQMSKPCTVSRTGYTGEDGCELVVRAEHATAVMDNLFRAGRDQGIRAAGLGARDTLRLEAGMPLYGQELSEQIDPYQAGLGFAVNLKDRSFCGSSALALAKQDERLPRRVGLALDGKRAARPHYAVFQGERRVGEVTSGAFSPTLQHPIAMAYVDRQTSTEEGSVLDVDIRGRRIPARVVKLPFYTRPK